MADLMEVWEIEYQITDDSQTWIPTTETFSGSLGQHPYSIVKAHFDTHKKSLDLSKGFKVQILRSVHKGWSAID
tara:strand:- start:1690 stop:1911 length:222 start_codon:yes stop_codon:yes gene_type:complete